MSRPWFEINTCTHALMSAPLICQSLKSHTLPLRCVIGTLLSGVFRGTGSFVQMKPLAGKFYIKGFACSSGLLSKHASGSELKYSATSQVPRRAILVQKQSKTKGLCSWWAFYFKAHVLGLSTFSKNNIATMSFVQKEKQDNTKILILNIDRGCTVFVFECIL